MQLALHIKTESSSNKDYVLISGLVRLYFLVFVIFKLLHFLVVFSFWSLMHVLKELVTLECWINELQRNMICYASKFHLELLYANLIQRKVGHWCRKVVFHLIIRNHTSWMRERPISLRWNFLLSHLTYVCIISCMHWMVVGHFQKAISHSKLLTHQCKNHEINFMDFSWTFLRHFWFQKKKAS